MIELANSLVARSVLGKGLLSPLEIDPGHLDFKRVEGAENVKACIIDLITTRVGERLMNEDIGTLLPDALFENREGILDILPIQLVEVITRFEPRVAQVQAIAKPFGETGVNVELSWVLRSTGRRENLVWPFYLNTTDGLAA